MTGMIDRVIVSILATIGEDMRDHWLKLNSLTIRVAPREKNHGASDQVTALIANINNLRKDLDYLKSNNFSSLLGTAKILDMPSADVPAYSYVPLAIR